VPWQRERSVGDYGVGGFYVFRCLLGEEVPACAGLMAPIAVSARKTKMIADKNRHPHQLNFRQVMNHNSILRH